MRTLITILALAAMCGATNDSLALARFRQDSTLAVSLLQQAARSDSTAYVQRIQARTIWELAIRNLQRDTTKAGK